MGKRAGNPCSVLVNASRAPLPIKESTRARLATSRAMGSKPCKQEYETISGGEAAIGPDVLGLKLLNESSNWRSFKTLKKLLRAGANVNYRSARGTTPLHNACSKRRSSPYATIREMKIIKLLVSNGADVNAVDDNGNTPLHSAVALATYHAVCVLMWARANVNARNINGDTPLHTLNEWHGVRGDDESIARILIRFGADAALENNYGETPLEKMLKANMHYQASEILKYSP